MMRPRTLVLVGLVLAWHARVGHAARDPLPSFAPVLREVERSVVNIATVARAEDSDEGDPGTMQELLRRSADDAPRTGRSLGSGFIISDDGEILTNQHVVAGAGHVRVRLDDEEFDAQVIGGDDRTDIALLRISAGRRLPVLKIGDPDLLEAGDWVLAVGNPSGPSRIASAGIVSDKGRLLGAGPSDDYIQTDAAIGSASSGGPLIDVEGRVLGVNTAIVGPTGAGAAIGSAVSIKLAMWVATQLRQHGRVVRGSIGVSIQPVTPELARSFGLEATEGALVADVTEDGPAARAGLRRGDVITRFGDHAIRQARELPVLVASTALGAKVATEYVRDGERTSVEVVVSEAADEVQATVQPRPHDVDEVAEWGLVLRPLREGEVKRAKNGGLVVEEVEEASPAEDAGIEVGDIIVQANRQTVRTLADLKKALTLRGQHALLLLQRGTASIYVELER